MPDSGSRTAAGLQGDAVLWGIENRVECLVFVRDGRKEEIKSEHQRESSREQS
jgi:hypothetical protein